MNEVTQKVKPVGLSMKIVDNETGEVSYKILNFKTDKEGQYYYEEEWREMSEKEKREWGVE